MARPFHRGWRLLCSLAVAGGVHAAAAAAAAGEQFETTAGNLLVVLRDSPGENKQDESLQPYGQLEGTMPDGRRVHFETSWYQYLGDMHIRLVFDGGQSLQSASPNDLERLKLSPEEALDLAVSNLRRVYGGPTASPRGAVSGRADPGPLHSSRWS